MTTDLIDKVSELSGLDFSQDSYLREMINKHMILMIYRLKNKITIENQTTEEIKKRYSILFNIVWLASKIVTDSYHIDFLDSEIAFLTIYFQIAVEKIEKPLEIVIVCPHGLATSELIFNTLRRLISPYDHLKKIDFSDVTDELVQDVDMIISSVELRQLSCNYILVSPVPSQFEVDKIQNFYHSLTDGNRKILSVVKDKQSINQSMVCDLIQNHIYLNQDCKTYDQVIQFLVNQDSSSELQTAYIDSIFQREHLGSTSVYTGIALPHANPRTVGKSGLKLLTLKQPIVWGANKVKVVMLISIKEGEEELYKDALIYLYSKIDDQHFIDQLVTATTTQEFMTRLFREE
ncbi:PTS sugar transporter subunit IIA [Streptococcus iniae]